MATSDKLDVKALLQSYIHYEWRINEDIPREVRKLENDFKAFMDTNVNGTNGLSADMATEAYHLKKRAEDTAASIDNRKEALRTVSDNIIQLMDKLGIAQISGMLDIPQGGSVIHTKTVTFFRKEDGSLTHT